MKEGRRPECPENTADLRKHHTLKLQNTSPNQHSNSHASIGGRRLLDSRHEDHDTTRVWVFLAVGSVFIGRLAKFLPFIGLFHISNGSDNDNNNNNKCDRDQ